MEDALADAVDLLTRRVVKYRKRLGTKLTAAAAEIPLPSRKKAWILCAKSTLP